LDERSGLHVDRGDDGREGARLSRREFRALGEARILDHEIMQRGEPVGHQQQGMAAVIGFVELTREGQLTTATTFRPFTVYLTVAALYFLLCFPLTQASRRLERRLHAAR